MPGAEAHSIVRSQDRIHMMIDYVTDLLPWPIAMMVYAWNQHYEANAEPNYVSKNQ